MGYYRCDHLDVLVVMAYTKPSLTEFKLSLYWKVLCRNGILLKDWKTVYTIGLSNFFWKNASNSMGNFRPKGKCIPIFIELRQRLTMCPKLWRSLVWLELDLSEDLWSLIHSVKRLQKWLKIGVQSGFGPKFIVEFEAFSR